MKQHVSFSTNHATLYGRHQSPDFRFLFFKTSGGRLLIDFNAYLIEQDYCYVVPARHFYNLEEDATNRDFVSMDIAEKSLTDPLRRLLFALEYRNDKSLGYAGSHVREQIKKARQRKEDAETNEPEVLEYPIQQLLIHCFRRQADDCSRGIKRPYWGRAQRLWQFLHNLPSNHVRLTVDYLSEQLYMHERTLRRLCHSVFHTTPNELVHYHLMLRAASLIVTRPEMPFSVIAEQLGFADSASFDHFFHAMTGQSPSDLRPSC